MCLKPEASCIGANELLIFISFSVLGYFSQEMKYYLVNKEANHCEIMDRMFPFAFSNTIRTLDTFTKITLNQVFSAFMLLTFWAM
jgi:hypothetical protein